MVKPVPTETTFEYDAIGNLIWDHDTDVKISWTPYGKVREVTHEDEEMVTTFRYDGSGNRIEKKVVKQEGGEEIVSTSRYVRDTSGNVMAIYKDEVMQEQSVYGSNRLGMFKGGIAAGQQMLGKREYELSNHLGNVLAVISDKVGMDGVDVYATEISVSDYYPFGLNMEGRGWQDTDGDYRYGFNGKEKDNFNVTVYDYGFRIYNPEIAKFLSVDPLTISYPGLTPYQFASNSPTSNTDLDGLESLYYQISHDKQSGKSAIKLSDIKTSYLDKLLPYHIIVSIDGGEYMYAGDYALSFEGQRKALANDLNYYAKNPQVAVAKFVAAKEDAANDAAENKQFWGHDLWVNAATAAWAANLPKGAFTTSSSTNNAIVPRAKFTDYIFKEGAKHGKDIVFKGLGYAKKDSEKLVSIYTKQANEKFAKGEYTLGENDKWGQRINIEIELQGIGDSSGKTSYLKTGWMKNTDGTISLNTPFTGFTKK